MRYPKTKTMKLIILIISLFVLFHIVKLIKVRISNIDLPKGKIVFSSYIDGDSEIYTMNINGTGLKQLTKNSATKTNTATDTEASFSPDGEKIVFVSRRQGQENRKLIYNNVGKPIGEEFSGGTFDIFIMDSDGKNQLPLTYNTLSSNPFFSPDAKKIIFRTLLKDRHTLVKLINIDGSGERTLSAGGQAKFSSDGKKIFDNFQSDVSVADIDGNNRVKLTHFSDFKERQDNRKSPLGIDFDLSRDGQKIAIVTEEDNLDLMNDIFNFYTMNVDGSNLEKIYKIETRQGIPGFLFQFRYSPNGDSIIFLTNNYERIENASTRQICLLNIQDKTLTNLTKRIENLNDIFDFTFTPDGKRIVFVAGISPKIYYSEAMPAVIFRIFKGYIYYFLLRKDPFPIAQYICIMDIDGKNYRRIAKLPIGSELGHDFIHWEE